MVNTFEKIFNFLLDASTGSAWLAWVIFILTVGSLWLFTDANLLIALLFGIPLSIILIIVCALVLFVCYLAIVLISELYCILTTK